MTRINDPKFPCQNHVTSFLIQLPGTKSIKSLATWEIKRLGQKIMEFHLHFKLSILFLDASTVQSGLQKLSIWGTFPFLPIFLLQNKRYFSLFSYIMKVQSNYEEKLTHLDWHLKKEQQIAGGSYALPLVQTSSGYHKKPRINEPPVTQSVFLLSQAFCSWNFTELHCNSE